MQCQNDSNGAIKVTVEQSTNTPIDLHLSGSDYIGPNDHIIPVQNTNLSIDNNASLPSAITLSKTPRKIFTNLGGKKPEEKQLWLWIDTPSEWTPGGQYISTYTFNAEQATN